MTKRGKIADETIVRRTTASGLEVLVVPKKDYAKKFALYTTSYGSIDNDFHSSVLAKRRLMPAGIAHFLEHKMFEKENGDLTDAFAQRGATTNAMTSFETTGYYFECADRFEENLALLSELVMKPYFTPKLVEKEKGIIAQEIKMYQDDPGWRGSMAVLKNLFGDHPVALDIAGTVESIKEITADDLHLCHKTFYSPKNLALVVVGEVHPDEVCAIAEEAAKTHFAGAPSPVVERFYPKKKQKIVRRTSEKWPLKSAKFFAGWRIDHGHLEGDELIDLETLLDLYVASLFARSGPLHKRLFEAGLIDDSFSVSTTVEREFAYASFSSDTPDPKRLEAELLDGLAEAQKTGPSKVVLARAKKMMFGRFVRGFNSLENIAWNVAECRAKGVDFLEWGTRLMALSDARVRAAGRSALAPDRFTSHVIYPG